MTFSYRAASLMWGAGTIVGFVLAYWVEGAPLPASAASAAFVGIVLGAAGGILLK